MSYYVIVTIPPIRALPHIDPSLSLLLLNRCDIQIRRKKTHDIISLGVQLVGGEKREKLTLPED